MVVNRILRDRQTWIAGDGTFWQRINRHHDTIGRLTTLGVSNCHRVCRVADWRRCRIGDSGGIQSFSGAPAICVGRSAIRSCGAAAYLHRESGAHVLVRAGIRYREVWLEIGGNRVVAIHGDGGISSSHIAYRVHVTCPVDKPITLVWRSSNVDETTAVIAEGSFARTRY